MRPAIIALALAACGDRAPAAQSTAPTSTSTEAPDAKDAVASLIGTKPPEWRAERWMNSPPLDLARLRGSVVMVRWWTADCPFCATTAPTLRSFDKEFGPRGLKVIGMYHHKEDTPFDPAVYEATAKKYEFTFPVAFDPEWHTLKSWLRDKDGKEVDTGWTSVTFLLDKQGVIRQVHPGGSFVEGKPGYTDMRTAVERLLAE